MRLCAHCQVTGACLCADAATTAAAAAANLVLQDTVERIYVGTQYGDIERGIYIVRGENVVLLGEIVRRLALEAAVARTPPAPPSLPPHFPFCRTKSTTPRSAG